MEGEGYAQARVQGLLVLPNVQSFVFCPEDKVMGTLREYFDIHGGGRRRTLDEK